MLALISGTGAGDWPGFAMHDERCPATPYGDPSAPLQAGRLHGREVVLLARHGRPHRIPPHQINYRANIDALHQCGVRAIVAINAVGGIHHDMGAGRLVVPHDIIDYTWGRAHTFSDGESGRPLVHVEFGEPFDGALRRRLVNAAALVGVDARAFGVYGATQGPRLETAAEIRRLERDGCDLVGMTAMPEAALAREAGIPYAMLCVVANPAAGKCAAPITADAINRVLATAMKQVQHIVQALLQDAAG